MLAPRILIAAPSGSGRKQIMLRKFLADHYYDTVSVLSTHWNPVYEAMAKGKTYRSASELPQLESFDRTKKHLIVIHLMDSRIETLVGEFWQRAASYGITCIYIASSYHYNAPWNVRRNCDIVCMANPNPTDALLLRNERPDLSLSRFGNDWQIWS
jgi:hypothetical protein